VEGNLVVDGDVDVDDPCGLVVLGDLRCRTFFTSEGEVIITGTLFAKRAAAFDMDSGGRVDVGAIRTEVLLVSSEEAEEDLDAKAKRTIVTSKLVSELSRIRKSSR
jgi:hypothetical protein